MPPFRFALLSALALAPVAAAEPTFQPAGVAFLKKHCLSCHGAEKPKADLSLHKYADDASLLKDRKVWQRVQEVIREGEMPPENKPQPARDEADGFLRLVTGVFDHADRTAKPDPGRVTMRRLNRNEYNNTIRDLIGVDFNPADDFPSDDVGHGFDNIGDVLTLPPVLMERYLAAAETIMERAILVNPPPVPKRYLAGRFLQPAPPDSLAGGRFRPIKPADSNPVVSGPLTAPADYLKFSADADLILRARLYAVPKGPSPVKVALFVSGGKVENPSPDAEVDKLMGAALKGNRPMQILKVFEITARDEKKVQEIEFSIRRRGDIQRAGVAVVRPPDGEEPPHLFVESIWSEGPLETRPKSHLALLACDGSKPPAARTREVLGRFLPKCYRRPVTTAEVERVAKLADDAVAGGAKWEAGVQLALTAALCSPKFLFRVELDDRPDAADAHAVDEFQLANRLSYFLWATMPDAELFDLAARKQLAANLDAQVKRMLRDPRAKTLVEHFVMQWLQLQNLKTFQPDPKRFPNFNEPLRAAMLQETRLFFEAIIAEDRSVLDILDANFTFVNPTLARHYGLNTPGTGGGGRPFGGRGFSSRNAAFTRVDLTGTNRGGILTQASVLAVTSNPTRTSPVKRGRWVLEQLLGTPPPPPPPNVPELEKDGKPLTAGTLRAQMEEHRKNPACANCHAKMDPLGFGLENFDAVGAFRSKDGEFAIDPSGELPGGVKFQGPAELKEILKGKKELFVRCLAEKMLTYALGRGLEYYDKRVVDRIAEQAAKDGYKFSAVVTAIVKSDPFRMRRGKVQ